MRREKCLEEPIRVHLPETLKRAIQDLAMQEDRKVSEWIRHRLSLVVFGEAYPVDGEGPGDDGGRSGPEFISRRRRTEEREE